MNPIDVTFLRIAAGVAIAVISAGVGVAANKLSDGTPRGLPVKYYNCDELGNDCRLYAAFKDMEMCEYHREQGYWSRQADEAAHNGFTIRKFVIPPPGQEGNLITKCVR